MTKNLELSIRIEINETDALPTEEAIQDSAGAGRFVLGGDRSLDIDALESGLLRTTYPALRDALASHLANEVKKMPNQAASIS
jgi:hypothetical protein